jgi:hypothetical protein
VRHWDGGVDLRAEGDDFQSPQGEDVDESANDGLSSSDGSDFVEELEAGTTGDTSPAGSATGEPDPMEKTRELLTPVVDLITLQTEMQGALQRLATSLETFAAGVISENIDKAVTVEGRIESLERELELTRERLRETEALLAAGAGAAAVPQPQAETDTKTGVSAPTAAAAGAAAAGAASFWEFESTGEASAGSTPSQTEEAGQPEETGAVPETAETAKPVQEAQPGTAAAAAAAMAAQSPPPPVAPPATPPPVAPPAGPATTDQPTRPNFQLPEVQVAQRYFNESQFTNRIRDVRRSLGRPKANLTKLIGDEPHALLTVTWDIIWYQYLIDLRRDAPAEQRVSLHREGMDLDELTSIFREKNASIDDEGRLDASELEVILLSDPSTLITEMSVQEEKALEDATEEIWDQRTAPEFKWDD